ncbi:MAG TPA: hypothetical protein VHX86_17085 [Tepidisphaeraceae bacterium]|jgi:hypothetical protein|nr:hypothetical protein [Tepidisphaeraceae bacterium]
MFLRKTAALLGGTILALGVGCSTTTNPPESNEKLAAYAGSVGYPSDVKTEESTTMGTAVDSDEKAIRIFNFGENELDGADIWINGSFVYKIDSLPGKSHVKLRLADFYDHDGHSFADTSATVTRVQIHAGDRLWTLLGPITQ